MMLTECPASVVSCITTWHPPQSHHAGPVLQMRGWRQSESATRQLSPDSECTLPSVLGQLLKELRCPSRDGVPRQLCRRLFRILPSGSAIPLSQIGGLYRSILQTGKMRLKRRDLPVAPAGSARRGGHRGEEQRPRDPLAPGGGGGRRRERRDPRGCGRRSPGFQPSRAGPGGAGRAGRGGVGPGKGPSPPAAQCPSRSRVLVVAGEWGRGAKGVAGRGSPAGSDPRHHPPARAGSEGKLRREATG